MRQFNTLTGFLLSKSSNPSINDIVEFSGYASAGDGGGAQWKHNGVTGQTPSQSPAQLGGPLLNDGNGNQWGLVYTYNLHLSKLGFVSLSAENRTKLIQGLSDSLTSTSARLISPEGSYEFAASTLVETWPNNNGGTIGASSAALIFRKNISYTGQGRDATNWFVSNPALSVAFIDNGSNTEVTGIDFSSTYTGSEAGAGHGLFNLVKSLSDTVTNLNIHAIRSRNVASYGIGLNYGYQANCTLHDIETSTTGADGIDIKSRSTDLKVNNTNTITKIRCKSFGLRLDGQVGLDVRGQCTIDDCWFTEFGDGVKTFTGLRLRPVSEANNLSVNSTSSNIHAIAASNINTTGIQVSGDNNKVVGFSVADCDFGVSSQESQSCSASDGTISGHRTNAIKTTVSAVNFCMIGIRAINANGATNHFRLEGEGASSRSVSGDSSANEWSLGSAANNTLSRDTPNNNEKDGVDTYEITAGRVGIKAKGPSANIDIALDTKGNGKLRVGQFSATSDNPIVGYLEIKDSSGELRRLAVVN